jgi:GT2 family glycosyltransferase
VDLPDISIIILEYHSVRESKVLISSIASALLSKCYEIIVSSNSCYESEYQEELIRDIKSARWIFNPINKGFAYGMNRGLKAARGRFIAICNSDIIISYGLHEMVDYLESHPEIGAIGPQVVDSSGKILDSCRPFLTLPGFMVRQLKRVFLGERYLLANNFNYTGLSRVDWINGAFILVTRRTYEVTGGLDENYFMYAEDMDWCLRMRIKGYEIVYFPGMRIVFNPSRKARRNLRYLVIFMRSHFRFWRKYGFLKVS